MSGQMTPAEFAGKVEWEGGVLDALDYGLRADDLDDSNPELKAAWRDLARRWAEDFEPGLRNVERMLDELEQSDGAVGADA